MLSWKQYQALKELWWFSSSAIQRIRHQTVCLARLITSLRIFLRALRLNISTALAIFQWKFCQRRTFFFLYFLSYLFIYCCIQNMYNLVLFTIIYVDISVTYLDLYFI